MNRGPDSPGSDPVKTIVERLNAKASNVKPAGKPVAWTLEEAQNFVLGLTEDALAHKVGWHFGITGSVLTTGRSSKDLDLITYPRDSRYANRRKLFAFLRDIKAMERVRTAAKMREGWKRAGKLDQKHVEEWRTFWGARVDLFVMDGRR